eukprot:4921260-Prymnesium_polylepis.1
MRLQTFAGIIIENQLSTGRDSCVPRRRRDHLHHTKHHLRAAAQNDRRRRCAAAAEGGRRAERRSRSRSCGFALVLENRTARAVSCPMYPTRVSGNKVSARRTLMAATPARRRPAVEADAGGLARCTASDY